MEFSKFIKNIIIIVLILGLAFASQWPYFSSISRDLYQQGSKYILNGQNWFQTNIYPRLSGEVEKRGEEVKKEIDKQKNNILQNIWEKIKNNLAEKFSKTFGTKVE